MRPILCIVEYSVASLSSSQGILVPLPYHDNQHCLQIFVSVFPRGKNHFKLRIAELTNLNGSSKNINVYIVILGIVRYGVNTILPFRSWLLNNRVWNRFSRLCRTYSKVWCCGCRLSLCLWCCHSSWVIVWVLAVHFCSSSLLLNLRKQWKMTQVLGHLNSHGRPRRNCGVQALIWSNSGHLKIKPVNGRLSVFPALHNFAFQTKINP